jgi:hypothetical protein
VAGELIAERTLYLLLSTVVMPANGLIRSYFQLRPLLAGLLAFCGLLDYQLLESVLAAGSMRP